MFIQRLPLVECPRKHWKYSFFVLFFYFLFVLRFCGFRMPSLTRLAPILTGFSSRAFVRLLCMCCPRKIRRKYQPTMRSKSQVSVLRLTPSTAILILRQAMRVVVFRFSSSFLRSGKLGNFAVFRIFSFAAVLLLHPLFWVWWRPLS